MEKMLDSDFEYLKSQYKQKNLKIGVELSEGRKFLTNIVQDKTCIIWGATFSLIMILSFFVSIYCLGFLGGIIYALVFNLLYSCYLGICSINNKFKKFIYYLSIAILIISFAFELKITILTVFTCLSIMSAYLFYNYILGRIVEEAFKNKEFFTTLLEDRMIILL